MSQRNMRGFSLIEMMAVISIGLIATGFAVMTLQPTLRGTRVTNAYNISLMALRQARDTAIGQRQQYYVTFNHNPLPPDTITITQALSGTVITTFSLPSDVAFNVLTGLPGAGKTPDNFGTGGAAIDFDQGVSGGVNNIVYFNPDGSAQDANGNLNNGILYISQNSDLYSSRAITVWGATGRMRGWRLFNNSGNAYWRQM